MPHRPTLDPSLRDKAKSLYLSGITMEQVADSLQVSLATIKTWSHRYQWPKIRREVKPVLRNLLVQEQVKVSAGIQKGLEQEGRKLRETLSLDLQGTATRLASHWASPDSIREELERSQVVRQVTAVAAQIYGWDKESITSTVRIGAMSSLDEGAEGEMPVVDVGPTSD